MTHVLKIIPKGIHTNTKGKTLSCMNDCNKNIQERIKPSAKVNKELDTEIINCNINLQHSKDTGKILETIV